MRTVLAAVAALMVAGGAQAQPAADAKTVEALVAKIYAGYRAGSDPEAAHKALPFDDSMEKILAKVEETNSEGVGFDPFCACQDYEITEVAVKAGAVDPTAATVTARFRNFGDWTTVIYKLVATPKGWRIHDLVLPEAPSFRALMIRAGNP